MSPLRVCFCSPKKLFFVAKTCQNTVFDNHYSQNRFNTPINYVKLDILSWIVVINTNTLLVVMSIAFSMFNMFCVHC